MTIYTAITPEPTLKDIESLKRQFVIACRILMNEGASEAAFNVSVRISGNQMITIPVTSPTLVTVDNLQTLPIAPGSSPWKAHPAIYLQRPDVNAIVHVHSPYAVAFGTLGEPFRAIHHYGTPFLDNVAVDDQPGQTESAEHAADLASRFGNKALLVQEGHGTIAVAGDLREAVLLTLYFEESCKIFSIARQGGGNPKGLSDTQCQKIRAQIMKPRSQEKAWNHYADKLTWRDRLKTAYARAGREDQKQ